MRKKIPIDKVKLGMYIASDIKDKANNIIIAAGIPIFSDLQLQRLKNAKEDSVYIDIEKGVDVDSDGELESMEMSIESEPDISDEVFKIDDFYTLQTWTNSVIDAVEEIFFQLIMRKKFSYNVALETADKIADLVLNFKDIVWGVVKFSDIDDYLNRHSIEVACLSALILTKLTDEKPKIRNMAFLGLLHDIGKLEIDENIINKPDRLTNQEYETVKRHVRLGYELFVKNSRDLKKLGKHILFHHERYNGTGYPLRKRGNGVDEWSYILGIADIYSAMSNDKVYKKKLTYDQIYRELDEGRDILFPSGIVDMLIEVNGLYPSGTFIETTSNELGIVMTIKEREPDLPLINLIFSRERVKFPQPGQIKDLNSLSNIRIKRDLDIEEWEFSPREYLYSYLNFIL